MLKYKHSAIIFIALSVASCATLPPKPEDRGVAVEALVEAVQCELKAASLSSPKLTALLSNYQAKAELELKLVDTNQAGASGQFVLPVSPETVSASFGIGRSASSTRKTTISFVMDIKKLQTKPCNHLKSGLPATPLTLGLNDWVVSAFNAVDDKDSANVSEATYSLEFILTTDARGNVSVTAFRIPASSLGGAITRQDTHSLIVGMTPKQGEPPPTKIEITSWPVTSSRVGNRTSSNRRDEIRPNSLSAGRDQGGTLRRLDTLVEREKLKRLIIER
jgi:hypothetical protein